MNTQRYWNYDRRSKDKSDRSRPGRGKPKWRGGSNFKSPRYGTDSRNQNHPFKNNVPSWNRSRRDIPDKRLSEEDIGVTEYISDHQGFSGVIKTRYSDFQVSEISEKGEVAELADLSAPQPPTDAVEEDEDEDLLLSKYNLQILTTDVWDRLSKLAATTEHTDEVVEIDATDISKEQRTKIHDSVKKVFGKAIVGSTVNVDGKKYVRFTKYRKGVRIDKRVKWVWPGKYVCFVLHKENCDTMDAAARLADRLRINLNPSLLGYAGTKDRRAKTSQWLTLRKVDPQRIANAGKGLKGIYVGNFTFRDVPLKLGMLHGNKFRIAIRNVTADNEYVETACERLAARGFLNYYGLQRFGSRADVPTHRIGLRALLGDFQGAIDLLLTDRECAIQHALRVYHERGPEAAVMVLPRYAAQSAIELRLLRALAQDPQDLLGAFNKLPRNARLLYLHAYQSLVWNRCLSERVRRLGCVPAPGDLVTLENSHHCEDDLEEEGLEEDYSHYEEETEDDSNVSEPQDLKSAEEENTEASKDKEQDDDKPKIPVKVLTQEDVDSGLYTFYDVVMPLPGYNVDYPPNMKDYYEHLLTADGLTLELRHKYRSYSLPGAYRLVCARPKDVSYQIVPYSFPHADLILSDADRLQGLQIAAGGDGKYKALLLTMSLPASCYATMALRELMRTGTGGDYQARQNNYHDEGKSGECNSEVTENVNTEGGTGNGNAESGGEKRKLEESQEEDVKKSKLDHE